MRVAIRICLFSLTVLYSTFVFSQVTITAADFNIISQDTVMLSSIDTANVSFPDGGQNQSWDYTNVVSQSSSMRGVGPDVAGSMGSSLFPNANILYGNSGSNEFQSWDTTKLEWQGIYYLNQTQPYYDLYTNPRRQRQFPFTYGDSFTDSSATTIERTTVTYTRKSLVGSEIIGYGDLTVPGEYYPEVLLEMYYWEGVTTAPGGGTNNFNDTSYYFWAPGNYYPVMFFFKGYSGQSGNISKSKSITLFGGLTYVDIEELSSIPANHLKVYPNPASDFINIDGNQTKASYSIVAVNGAVLQSGTFEESSIQIERLPPGTYLLLIQEEESLSMFKFIKH